MPSAAISINSLQKFFPPQQTGWRAFLQPFSKPTAPALNNISFEVSQGESVALLGANGAGKSTLLRILATLLLPTSGTASLAGFDTHGNPRGVRRSLGYHAGSDLGFYARLTGRENLLFFARLNRLPHEQASRRIAALANQFQLDEALDKQVRTLSSGNVQRLSLVRALLHEPPVLLLDEPTRSLDAFAATTFRQFLKREILGSKKSTLLFASHTLPEIELLADRIAVIDSGNLLAFEAPASLIQRTGSANLEQAFLKLTGHSAAALSPEPSA